MTANSMMKAIAALVVTATLAGPLLAGDKGGGGGCSCGGSCGSRGAGGGGGKGK
jgi:hypothetical protein